MIKFRFMLVLFLIFSSQSVYAANKCNKKTLDADIVVNCFKYLYFKKYDQLWGFLNKENKHLVMHGDSKNISKHLTIVNVGGGNAEYLEHIHEFVENSLVKNTNQFFGALLLLDKETLDRVFYILSQPIYVSYESLISILKNNADVVEYQDIHKNIKKAINKLDKSNKEIMKRKKEHEKNEWDSYY